MDIAEIKQLLETEVPQILRESPGFRTWLRDFVHRLIGLSDPSDNGSGLIPEEMVRTNLRKALEQFFGLTVFHLNEYDHEGLVFNQPDEVELDIVVRDGTVLVFEFLCSVSKNDVYMFERKIRFFEKLHECTASRRIIVSPTVEARARALAEELGMEVFSFAEDVSGLA